MAIVIVAAYISALLNTLYGRGIIATIIVSWLCSIIFTLLILFLSNRLSRVYFIVGTLALYMFFFQGTQNRSSLTRGSLGIT